MNLPSTLFETTTRLNDNASDDMQYGDMNEQQLLSLGLHDISAKVDPYRLIRYDFPQPQYASSMLRSFSSGTKITHKECVNILFDEIKELSHLFSFWGEYKKIITELINHFGLDLYDIKDDFYRKFRFFRIWFFLQRHKDFAFKPFFTNFYTIERIAGYL